MPESIVDVAERMLVTCMALKTDESLLIITDGATREIGEALFAAGNQVGASAMLMIIPPTGRHGAEPTAAAAAAMKLADVVICPTRFSLTHTQARLQAVAAGTRVATMPGITQDMFFAGPISADYEAVAAQTQRLAQLLTNTAEARIVKGGKELVVAIEGRKGIASTGLYRERGQSGNLPSGEAYIAPVEGRSQGEMIIDGSLAGYGKVEVPFTVTVEGGKLVSADGAAGAWLLNALGDTAEGRNLGELGVGTNDKARLTGVVLEDEKLYGTVHIAFGDNSTFGGATRAGVHIDGVILEPDLFLDGQLVVSDGKLLI